MKLKSAIAAAALVGVTFLSAGSAQAASVTYTDSYGPQLTELAGEPLMVSLFDPTVFVGKVLTNVLVTISATLTTTGQVKNDPNAGVNSFTLDLVSKSYTGTKASGPAALPTPINVFAPFTIVGTQVYSNMNPGDQAGFGLYSISTGTLTQLNSNNAGVLAQFVGVGQFEYDFTTIIAQTFTGGGGNASALLITGTSNTLSVTYDYTDAPPPQVPEPASLVLLGVGLVGLARQWKKKRA